MRLLMFILLLITAIVSFPLNGCAAAKKSNTSIPKIDLKLYQGMPDKQGIVREQSAELLKCAEPKFQDFVCLSHEDFQKVIDAYILGCKEWK